MGCCLGRNSWKHHFQSKQVVPVLPTVTDTNALDDDAALALSKKLDGLEHQDVQSEGSFSSSADFEMEDETGLSPEQRWAQQSQRQERQAHRANKLSKTAKDQTASGCRNPIGVIYDSANNASPAKLEEYYQLTELLGRGSYSVVSLCLHLQTGRECALKTILRKKAPSSDQLKEEVEIMRMLSGRSPQEDLEHVDHPNIVKLLDCFEEKKCIHLVLELCSGGDLSQRLTNNPLPDKVAASLSKQMTSAINHLHFRCIAHRDVKPENFLLEKQVVNLADATLKMTDFGLSRRFVPGDLMKTLACTAFYVAPEVLNGSYTEACDLWSLGVTMFVLLCGIQPFAEEGCTEKEVFSKVKEGKYNTSHPAWSTVSIEAKDILQQLLRVDAKQRPKAHEVFWHHWFAA